MSEKVEFRGDDYSISFGDDYENVIWHIPVILNRADGKSWTLGTLISENDPEVHNRIICLGRELCELLIQNDIWEDWEIAGYYYYGSQEDWREYFEEHKDSLSSVVDKE